MLTMTVMSLSHKNSATYDVQDAQLHGGRENISIQCVFASGSQARGSHVKISNSSVQININRNGDSQSHTPEQTVTVLAPERLYEVFILTGREMVQLPPHHPTWAMSMCLHLKF